MIFFNINTETEYTSIGTYLCLLCHIVAFDIKALVPWHVVACLFNQVKTASFRSSPFAKRLLTRCSFIFGNRKKSDGARSGLYGGCSKMSQWNCYAARLVSAGQYADVHCRATEQFHARACLFGKMT